MRKRKVNYPPAKTATRRAPAPGPDPTIVRRTVANIDMTAGAGRAGLSVGDRVLIQASGLYSGRVGVIERLVGGVIPAAEVRVEDGGSRRVRTVDLQPVGPDESASGVDDTAANADAAG